MDFYCCYLSAPFSGDQTDHLHRSQSITSLLYCCQPLSMSMNFSLSISSSCHPVQLLHLYCFCLINPQFLLSTYKKHLNLASLTLSSKCSTFTVLLSCPFLILSILVPPSECVQLSNLGCHSTSHYFLLSSLNISSFHVLHVKYHISIDSTLPVPSNLSSIGSIPDPSKAFLVLPSVLVGSKETEFIVLYCLVSTTCCTTILP